jgi:predicted nuclease of predicted toxin-antitoxin system
MAGWDSRRAARRSHVRLLFDENLSYQLKTDLLDLFPDSLHVAECGLRGKTDVDIWTYAKAFDLAIVTKDRDFAELVRAASDEEGWPPVVLYRGKNSSVASISQALRAEEARIRQHVQYGGRLLAVGPWATIETATVVPPAP